MRDCLGRSWKCGDTCGSTHLLIELVPTRTGTRLTLTHSGLVEEAARKHAIGWPHFLVRLAVASEGRDPGKDPWSPGGEKHLKNLWRAIA